MLYLLLWAIVTGLILNFIAFLAIEELKSEYTDNEFVSVLLCIGLADAFWLHILGCF